MMPRQPLVKQHDAHVATDARAFEGCDALGQLAAYGQRAKKQNMCTQRAFEWVLQLYLGARDEDRFRGARALSATLDLAPSRVKRALRLRLGRAAVMDAWSSSDREKREEWLHDALKPLLKIKDSAAAQVGEDILTRYRFLGGQGKRDINEQFLNDVDEVRGCIALFDDEEMSRILVDLKAEEVEIRRHAASALRNMGLEQPKRIKEVICQAIRLEKTPSVMNQLLWAAYRLTDLAPDDLLESLDKTATLDWSTPSSSAGQTLATLSNIGYSRPEQVATRLPRRLESYSAESRAWLSEGLAFAWWVCAETVVEAREILVDLATPELDDVPREFHLLALRGAVMAQLGLVCLGSVSSKELQGRQMLYQRTDLQFHAMNTIDFVRSHAAELVRQPDIEHLLGLLVQCLIEEDRKTVHPIYKPLYSAHAMCGWLCLDMLISLAKVDADPVALLRRLPPGRNVVYAVRRLIEAGIIDQSITTFAHELCTAPIEGRSVFELEERERLLGLLASLSQAPRDVLQELRSKLPSMLFTADDRASALTKLADEHLEEMLPILSEQLQGVDDLAVLQPWVEQTRSWQGLLISRVYARMFDHRPIRCVEARELCEQMLAAVQALPDSPLQQEYLIVYRTLANWLSDSGGSVPTLPPFSAPQQGIERSHAAALELLRHVSAKGTTGQAKSDWLVEALLALQNSGWWSKSGWFSDGHTVHMSRHGGMNYVFPAVRLALVAAEMSEKGRRAGDPAARFLAARETVSELLSEYDPALDPDAQVPRDYLETALAALQNIEGIAKKDERVWLYRGILLLRLDRPQEAEMELEVGRELPTCIGTARALVLANLACVYAQTNREEQCQAALEEALQLDPLLRPSLRAAPDFEKIQETAWFQTLLQQEE